MEYNRLKPGDVYAVAAAILPPEDIDYHNSDLYLKYTTASAAIVSRLENKALLTVFTDPAGVKWFELPFCYIPYWNNPSKYY